MKINIQKLSVCILLLCISYFAQAQKRSTTIIDSIKQLKNNKMAVITGNDTSKINWTTQYIEAKGWSVIDTITFTNKTQAELMAARGAVVIAQRNLLERIKGVNITGETLVKNYITTDDKVRTKLEGFLQGAEQVGDYVVKKNKVEVLMRVPIYKPVNDTSLAGIFQKKKVTLVDTSKIDKKSIPQVMINVKGKYNPSLFPRIVNEKGDMVLDMAQYYDASNGNFPNIVNLTNAEIANYRKQGIQVLEGIQNANGNITVNPIGFDFEKWVKIIKQVGKIASFLLLLL